ncbi:IclR family transcriptional regulator [Glutamicibacter protophormiae]|uniref:IclR family transcriptional regulator n=1 Tax=Kocuria sp. TaxID=1871328 RepID=UPI000B974B72|nr:MULTISPECIES: IclR family transcriptional regulator [Kocuria]MDN5630614.1 IclR family transcriptional regulator [Kocuria sp.]WNB90138.1 IclR family transcriptional regulator [Glutamicibacter protophormiae]
MDGKSAGGVQSVERVFDLLSIITASGGESSLSELASRAELPLPTIHRLLRTLIPLGYVRQLPNRSYALGPGLIRLGNAAGLQLGTYAQPVLQGLVDELGESANMAVLDGQMVVYVGQAQSSHSMRMFTEVGRRAHMHDTGVGKAILATLPEQQVLSIVTSMGMPTPTVKSHGTVESLLADLEVIRERGYAVDDEEQEIGVRCFSMVLPNAPTPTAISVSGPTTRVDWEFGERAVPLLRDAAQRLSAQFASAG